MAPTTPPSNDIEKKARQALRAAAIKEIPVDLERVLAYLRLHHERPWHLKSDVWDALTRSDRGRTRFKGQAMRATARERWKLAHEIGHHVMHGAEPVRAAGQWQKNELEHEADLFAAELLMPPVLLKKAAKTAQRSNQMDVEELAHEFKVGRNEMEKRLRQLGLLTNEILGRI